MSLSSALQIGRSGLLASQAAIAVTGNNIANVAVAGYHRQAVSLTPAGDQQLQQGIFLGRGVQLESIVRQVSAGLESRLRDSQSDEAGYSAQVNILSQLEAIQNELSDNDLSSHLTNFFNAWSELGNNPTDNSLRAVVIEQGGVLASYLNTMQAGLNSLRSTVDSAITQDTQAANDLLTQIASVNQQIVLTEGGSGEANSLRDQRDVLLAKLSQYMDISTNEHADGSLDVFVGSLPLVLGNKSRGVEVRTTADGDKINIDVVISDDGSVLSPQSGSLGAMIRSREDDVMGTLKAIDSFTNNLIYEVNKIHSQGQGTVGFSSITSADRVADASLALNDPDAQLDFTPTHGSFKLYVTQKSTGQRVESSIAIDLDGIGPDSTLNDVAAAINGVANISASVTSDNRLSVSVNGSDYEISFGEDTSGILAVLGINTFFTGSSAQDIAINQKLQGNPANLAVSQSGSSADNTNALAMATLSNKKLGSTGNSLSQQWEQQVQTLAIKLNQAMQKLDASIIVRENLTAQQQSYSGVNIDEETINLLAFQRAYQGSARFLGVVDEMMQTLLQLL